MKRTVTATFACMALLAVGCSGDDAASGGASSTTGGDTAVTGVEGETATTAASDEGNPGAVRPPTDGTDAAGVVEGTAARIVGRLGPDGGVPLSDGDFADPFVLDTGLVPIGFTSNTLAANVPVSRGGPRGEVQLGDALPEVGSWSEKGLVWAPGVLKVSSDRYVLYYTSLHTASGRQCIGVAVADNPIGPYVDDSAEPLVCELADGGSIDASPFLWRDEGGEGGTPYLLWKVDGNCCDLPTPIRIQELSEDGTSLVGEPTELIRNDLDWEGPLVEGPSMIEAGGKLHLFWSANRWDTGDYAIGHGVCESPLGPCTKDPEPFVVSGEEFQGPGGQEFFTDRAGRVWMAFHGWLPGQVGYGAGGSRRLFVEEVTFDEAGVPNLS